MDILAALQQSQAKSNRQAILDSSDHIKYGVWEATLYRIGKDIKDYEGVLPSEREAILNRLEK